MYKYAVMCVVLFYIYIMALESHKSGYITVIALMCALHMIKKHLYMFWKGSYVDNMGPDVSELTDLWAKNLKKMHIFYSTP